MEPFCINGDCIFDGYEPNEDMAESIAQFKILTALQKIQDKSLSIFKGGTQKCRTNFSGHLSCCGRGNGWGTSIGARCNASEKQLAYARNQKLCHKVGTYCAKKILGKCIQKKQSFCCFDSKVSRIFQEQARKQLGIGWGKAKSPKCRGLTIEELTSLDWEKFDLSELFKEVFDSLKQPDLKALERKTNEAFERSLADKLQNSVRSSMLLPEGKG